MPLTGLRLPEAVGVPGPWQSPPQLLLVWVVDRVVVGAAGAPPEGLADAADVVEGFCLGVDDVGVVALGVVVVDVVVDDEEEDELVVAAGADVWAAPVVELADF